jgi:hypothetical protein
MSCGGAVLMRLSLALREQPGWPARSTEWLCLAVLGSRITLSTTLRCALTAARSSRRRYPGKRPGRAFFMRPFVAAEGITGRDWIAASVLLAGFIPILRGKTQQKAE